MCLHCLKSKKLPWLCSRGSKAHSLCMGCSKQAAQSPEHTWHCQAVTSWLKQNGPGNPLRHPFLQVAEFTQVLQQLPTGALLAAAFITYLGKEPEDVRQAKLTQWCVDLKLAAPWSLIKFLPSETEQLAWKPQGT
jgi:hypothetical protein